MRASEESRCAIHPEMLVCSFDDEIVVIIRREQRVSAANAAQEPAASIQSCAMKDQLLRTV